MHGPRVTLRHLMAATAVLAVVFALMRLPFGFMLAVGLHQRLTHEHLFLTPEFTDVSATAVLLMVAVCQGLIFGTLGSIPVWLITDLHRLEREREEAREAMAVDDDDETAKGDQPS